MPLHEAQHITSLMLGYKDWHGLEKATKSAGHPASLLDEQCSPAEQADRINYQVKVLSEHFPQTEPVLKALALKFRVSAGSPFAAALSEDGYRQNALFYWEPFGENPEWRFRPSARSEEKRDELYDLLDSWGRGEITLGDYLNTLEQIVKVQPENLTAYLYMISACGDLDCWAIAEPYLPKLEAAILNLLPPYYPMRRKVPAVNWWTVVNRDYLRSLYYLAEGYYAAGRYKKAKQWFLFLTRCSERELGHEKFFLRDLRQAAPAGDVHLMESEDLCDRYLCPTTGKWLC